MKKRMVWSFGISSFICLILFTFCLIDYIRYPKLFKGLTPFHSVLQDQGNHSFHGIFQTEYSEFHYVGIIFPKETPDIEVNKLIENWRSFGLEAKDKLPPPDLYWIILYKNKIVYQGKGGQKDVTSWNGDAFVCGEFQAKSGYKYEIQVFFGPKFEPFLKYSPKIEIGVASAAISVGLAWGKGLSIPMIIGFGVAGLVFLFLAIGANISYQKKALKANDTKSVDNR